MPQLRRLHWEAVAALITEDRRIQALVPRAPAQNRAATAAQALSSRTLWRSRPSMEQVHSRKALRLLPEKGRDLVTLVTCTPYSVNTHRLLVTGERDRQPRTEAKENSETRYPSDDTIENIILAVIIAAVSLILFIRYLRRKTAHEE